MPSAAAAAADAALALADCRRLTKLNPHLLHTIADPPSIPSKAEAEAAALAAAGAAAHAAAEAKAAAAEDEAEAERSAAARAAARAALESVPVVAARAAGPGPTAPLWQTAERKVLFVRKPGFGLPTACPICLPVLLYLRLAKVPFDLYVDTSNPNADHIPYVEFGNCVAFNNEEGGVIDFLRDKKIVDLNSNVTATKCAISISISTWLVDAVNYELWIASDGSIANDIYFSDLAWPIRKILHWKRSRDVKHQLGLNLKPTDIYRKADAIYGAFSGRLLNDEVFLINNKPTEVDALFLGHAFFVLNALSDTSMLKCTLKKHERLVRYAQHHMCNLLEMQPSENLGNLTSGM